MHGVYRTVYIAVDVTLASAGSTPELAGPAPVTGLRFQRRASGREYVADPIGFVAPAVCPGGGVVNEPVFASRWAVCSFLASPWACALLEWWVPMGTRAYLFGTHGRRGLRIGPDDGHVRPGCPIDAGPRSFAASLGGSFVHSRSIIGRRITSDLFGMIRLVGVRSAFSPADPTPDVASQPGGA